MTAELVQRDFVDDLRQKALALIWGDRVGLLIFLASLCLFGLVWRTSFVINDSYTIANGLYAVQHGSLDMATAAYGPGLETPGAESYDGKLFSRNYGVIVAALPLVYLLQALELVADLRIVLIAVWCLVLLAAILLAGRVLNRRRRARFGGSAAVLGLFALNVALATPLDPPQHHLLALQMVHMVGAAFVGVFTYRLVMEVHERRRALLATALVTLGTPLAFWAAVPKRHVLTAAVALAVAFAIARSRDGDRSYLTATRAIAYGVVGLLAWVHAPEALVVLVALVVVDLPTAPSNDARTLAIVGGVFLLSLLPMVATNMAITGDPLKPPRMLRSVDSGADVSLDAASDSSGSADGSTSSSGDSGEGGPGTATPTGTTDAGAADAETTPTETSTESVGGDGNSDESVTDGDGSSGFAGAIRTIVLLGIALFNSAGELITTFVDLLSNGVSKVATEPGQLYHAFLRSGHVDRVARRAEDAPAANLSLLESAPVLAGLLAVVPLAWTRSRSDAGVRRFLTWFAAVDAFVVLFAVGYSLVYVSRLPIHAQVTVRYLFPLYPLAVYGLVRLPSVGGVLADNWRSFAWTYAASILVGGQLLLVTLVFLEPGRGEAFQFHALLALGIATILGLWSLTGRTSGRWGQLGATSMALATAAATTFVFAVSLEYYSLGDSHALPMMRTLAELVRIL